ncbi:MAG: hypothetical protein KZQ56_07345 [gamma proteobacterium symbiont of Lucinoma myriamae]|nr:hypothetical protein [gamma proteobacterium symbiont of Lucinoma myriamae]MCU7832406.1 hypothetical protein [gamma proteobacterium symbiont of Lucinoma myriamae]
MQEKEPHIGCFSPKNKQDACYQKAELLFRDSNKYHENQKRLLKKNNKKEIVMAELISEQI